MPSDAEYDTISHSLGLLVRKRREALGLSQEQLAHRTGLSQRRIWEIERAKTSPQLVTWLRLARGLEAGLGELISHAEAMAAAEAS